MTVEQIIEMAVAGGFEQKRNKDGSVTLFYRTKELRNTYNAKRNVERYSKMSNEERKEQSKKSNDLQKKLKDRRRREGRCIRCESLAVEGKTMCQKHCDITAEYQRGHYARKKGRE